MPSSPQMPSCPTLAHEVTAKTRVVELPINRAAAGRYFTVRDAALLNGVSCETHTRSLAAPRIGTRRG